MKKEELMIGDWVSVTGTPMRIVALGTMKAGFLDGKGEMLFHDYDSIEPIPLTKEIFEKNGFQKNKISNHETRFYIEQVYEFLYVRDVGIPEFDVGNSFDEEGELQGFATIKYVHELPHALRLCQIEKEIEI